MVDLGSSGAGGVGGGLDLGLTGKHVLVTGGSRGIGAACARAFGRAGAVVAVHYRTDAMAARRVVESIREAGGTAEAYPADLARWSEGERLVGEVETLAGALDVVVVNHGIWKGASIDRMTEAEYDEMMDVNLRGVFAVTGAAVRRMKPRKTGRIVFVASTAGQRGEAHHAHYAATKGAVISLTKSLATELAPDGILVNCVAPGWVATDMSKDALDDPKERAAVHATIPLRRVATPDEIAGPIVFASSALATFVTGEIVNVNGGAVLVG